jgi:nucleoside-diphosphate-sugar epimerase
MRFEAPDPERWVPDGYVIIHADSRGAGASPGMLDAFSPRETEDLATLITWAAHQSWSSGKVGLLGTSYHTINQWQVAAREKQGLASMMIRIAQKKGVSAYVEDGHNRWPAVHRLDAARLFRLALEKGCAGARYHAVAEEGVPVRTIAELIGQRLGVPVVSKSPEEAAKHFSWLATFLSVDNPTPSRFTEERLGWRPTQPGLIPDLDHARYFEA